MKQSKDPFEAAFEESPPDSPTETEPEPVNPNSNSLISQPSQIHEQQHLHVKNTISNDTKNNSNNKDDEEDEEEDEDNMDVELAKFRAVGDPHKMAKMHSILSQFTDEQMSRYESFRRAGFQKAKMTRVLASIIGTQTVSQPITIVVSGIAKMFVGEVVET
ncbi:hTAFII28-like motif protein, partial [Medicago truncatula]